MFRMSLLITPVQGLFRFDPSFNRRGRRRTLKLLDVTKNRNPDKIRSNDGDSLNHVLTIRLADRFADHGLVGSESVLVYRPRKVIVASLAVQLDVMVWVPVAPSTWRRKSVSSMRGSASPDRRCPFKVKWSVKRSPAAR
mgnify:CR=1 FL=1